MAKKEAGQYAVGLYPRLEGNQAFLKDFSKFALKIRKIYRKAFSLTNIARGGVIGSGIAAGLNEAENRVKSAGKTVEDVLNRAEETEILGKQMGVSSGTASGFLATTRAFGLENSDVLKMFTQFQDKLASGAVKAEGKTGFDKFLNTLTGVMNMQEGEKKTALISDLFGSKLGMKTFELMQSNSNEFLSAFEKINKGTTESSRTAEISKASKVEDRVAIEKERIKQQEMSKIAGLSEKEIADLALYEQRQAFAQLNSNLKDVPKMIENAVKTNEIVRNLLDTIVNLVSFLTPVLTATSGGVSKISVFLSNMNFFGKRIFGGK